MKKKDDFHDLYEMYSDRLLAYFMANRIDHAQAEDFVQDVFLRYHKAGYGYELDQVQSRVTLFRIAKNVFFDHLRRLKTKRKLGVSDEQLLQIHPDLQANSECEDPLRSIESEQKLDAVIAKLQALPPKCREVFIDFRFRNLPQKEIAQRRKISISMVEKHVATAISKLKNYEST